MRSASFGFPDGSLGAGRRKYAVTVRRIGTDTGQVILTRNWSLFLIVAGAFNWVIWPRFAVAIWQDQRAWSGAIGGSSPTSFLVVHAVLIVTAVILGTIIAVLGVRGFLADRRIAVDSRPTVTDRA